MMGSNKVCSKTSFNMDAPYNIDPHHKCGWGRTKSGIKK
jgi:hypothetical protein